MSLTGKPALTTAEPITNDGFWPDLELGDLMAQYRIPAEYDSAVISMALKLAMHNTNTYLQAVRDALVLLEYTTLLSAATAYSVETPAIIHYNNAVFSRAKAMLLQQFNTMNRRPNAENAVKTAPETEDYLMRESAYSVKRLFDLFAAAEVLENESASYGDGVLVSLL